MTRLFSLVLVAVAAVAFQGATVPPGCDECEVLGLSAVPTALEEAAAADVDTSLLQHKLQVEPAAAAPHPELFPDIPEAASAVALWQHVSDGPADPSVLVNSTELPLPGSLFPHEPQILKQHARENGLGFTPGRGVDENSPQWVVNCLGKDYKLNPVSSWTLSYVGMPQMLSFVVPLDQPGRTDVSVVICPGGGGQVLDWEIEGTDIAKSLNTMGISAFVLKYRIPVENWAPGAEIMDAQRALGLVRHHAAAWGLNVSRVGMFGASHGGVTATFTSFATRRLYPRRDAADDWNQKPDFWLLLYPQLEVSAFAEAAAGPVTIAGVDMDGLGSAPPTFIAAGADDGCCKVENMYSFHELLKLHSKAPVEINVYSDVGHYWATCFRRGKEMMLHEACLWLLRARHFIMWNVEGKVPSEIDDVFLETIKYVNPLLVRNVSR